MDQTSVYALLAAGAYWDVRRKDTNQAPLPPGWKVLDQFTVSESGGNATTLGSGFSARVYQGPNNQIVISYAGTEFDDKTTAGLVNDFLSGNFPLSSGGDGSQAHEAAILYERVQAAFGSDTDISFTGHSLGGGLAGLMAVWFNRRAIVFDPAPFAASAIDTGIGSAMTSVRSDLVAQGIADAQFDNYVPSQDYAARKAQVSSYAVDGEILQVLPPVSLLGRIEASRTPFLVGAAPNLSSGDKHSIDLLAAVSLVPAFETVVTALPNALPLLFDHDLYGPLALGTRQNLLVQLVRGEVGVYGEDGTQQSAPTGLLTKFTNDLNKLTSPSGMTGPGALQKGLIVAAMEYYYYSDPANATALFSTGGSGVHFDLASIKNVQSDQKLKSRIALTDDLKSFLSKAEWSAVGSQLLSASAWDIQTGDANSGMFWTAGSAASEVMVGGVGSDNLQGGSGADILIGGFGQDFLTAGAGNETLLGGQGNDFYSFNGAFGTDIVVDSDGQGNITFDGSGLGVAKAAGDNVWTSQSDGGESIGYALFDDPLSRTGKSLAVTRSGTAGTIIVRDFDLKAASSSDGYLGIKLQAVKTAFGTASPDEVLAGNAVTDTGMGSDEFKTFAVDFALPTATDQTLLVTLSGGSGSDFTLSTGSALVHFSGGQARIPVPEGSNSLTLTLINTGDPGGDQQLKLDFALLDASDNNTGLEINQLTVDFTADTPNAPPDSVVVGEVDRFNPDLTHYDATTDNSLIVTGDGTNEISASNGNDSIKAGAGNDTIVSGKGDSTISGGGGQDEILVRSGNNEIYADKVVDLATAIDNAKNGSATGQQGTLIGTGDGDNTIVGGSGNDLILVGQGDNVIIAGPGNDTIGAGNAITSEAKSWATQPGGTFHVYYTGVDQSAANYDEPPNYEGAMADSDGLPVGVGNDTIYGGKGDSVIFLSNGDNYVDAGGGNDSILGGMGQDTIFCGTGNVTVWGGGGDTYIDAESGDDYLLGQGGNNTIYGGTGNDTIFAGEDSIIAGDNWDSAETGDNYVDGGSGNSEIWGSGGNDTLIGGTGNVSIYGGAGNEYIETGDGDDSVNGGSGTNVIVVGDGTDTIHAGDGDTTIYGGGGTDYIEGGSGSNVLYAGDGGTADGATTVWAGDGDTTIYGGFGTDELHGGDGTDVIYVGDGGTDLAPTLVFAGSGDTTIYGEAGTAHIFGGSGTDVIYAGDGGTDAAPTEVLAGSGDTTIYGGAGSDVLQGGSGATTLVAGTGSTTLIGGSGSTTYEIGANAGDVVIIGFQSSDVIDLGEGISIDDVVVAENTAPDGTSNGLVLGVPGGSPVLLLDATGDSKVGIKFSGAGTNYTLPGLIASTNSTITTLGFDRTATGYSTTTPDGNGTSTVRNYDPSGTLLNYAEVSNDGHGNSLTVAYTATGTKTSDSWTHADGSYGNDTFNADGSVAGDAHNADGSETKFTDDGHGSSTSDTYSIGNTTEALVHVVTDAAGTKTTTRFDWRGALLSDTVQRADGSGEVDVVNPDGSSVATVTSVNGTSIRTTVDIFGNTVVAQVDVAGRVDSDSWTNTDGSRGADTYNADGSSSGTAQYVAGTSSRYVDDGHGNRTTTLLDSAGVAVGDTSQRADGSKGSDTFNGDGSISSISVNANGTITYTDTDTQGHVTTHTDGSTAQDTSTAATLALEKPFVSALSQSLISSLIPPWAKYIGSTPLGVTLTVSDDAVIEANVDPTAQITDSSRTVTSTQKVATTTSTRLYDTWYSLDQLLSSGSVYGSNGSYISFNSDQLEFVYTRKPNGEQELLGAWAWTGKYAVTTSVQTVTTSATYDNSFGSLVGGIQQINTGDSNHTIELLSAHGIVNAGAGNDYIGPGGTTALNATDGQAESTYQAIYSYKTSLSPGVGSFLNAGGGNDTVVGTVGDDSIVGGAGSDFLNGGGGSDTYLVFTGADQGWDVIDDTGYFDQSTVADWQRQMFKDYGGPAPTLDTVAFQAGVTLGQLQFSWGELANAGGQAVLNISWGNNAGIRVVVPSADLRAMGEGIETFTFADGTTLSMDDMLALAPPEPAGTSAGGSGSDTTPGAGGSDTQGGGTGDATLIGGSGDETFVVGDAATTIQLGSGNSTVTGGDANVTLVAGSAGSATVTLGNGNSTLDFSANDNTQTVKLGFGSNTVRLGNGSNLVMLDQGTAPAGQLPTSNDVLTLGTGTDTVTGGDSNVTLTAGSATGYGTDFITLGGGNDALTLGQGTHLVQLGNGSDSLSTGNGYNSVVMGNGNDRLQLGNGGGSVTLGDGGDTVVAGDGYLGLTVGNGSDTITVGSGGGTFQLGNGNDSLTSAGGYTSVRAGDGADQITLAGNGSVTLGTGNDDVTVGDGGSSITLSDGHDHVVAGNGYNSVTAGSGSDSVTVGNGGSSIQLGSGNDTVIAGNGYNYVALGDGNDSVRVGDGGSNVQLGNGNDTIVVGNGYNAIRAGNGNDTVSLGTGGNSLTLGSGTDRVVLGTGSGNDTIQLGGGVDTIVVGDTAGNVAETGHATLLAPSSGTNNSTELLFSNAASDQLWFQRSGNDLEIGVIGTSFEFDVSNWYGSSANHLQEIVAADGKVLIDTQVDALVNAMASFNPPASGAVVLPDNYQAQLHPVIAANWH